MPGIQVKYVDLALHFRAIEGELIPAVVEALRGGAWVGGGAIEDLERELCRWTDVPNAVAVANGTDALLLSLRALGIGPGDEVVTQPNSFIATAGAIALAGARPVFADVRDDFNIDPDLVARAVTPRTKAIIPVHLTGRPADMGPILAVARNHGLAVVEDAAQAIGASYDGQRVGSFGTLACLSLHPLKNLGACGDAGAIVTRDAALAARLRKMRNHGLKNRDESEFWGHNSRLDTLQAALLLAKLRHLESWTEGRRANAAFYRERLANVVEVPLERPNERAVYHTFIIQADRRDDLKEFLLSRGVETKVHYPIPIHLQEAARGLGYGPGSFPRAERQAGRILSVPVYPELSQEQKQHVVDSIRAFYGLGGDRSNRDGQPARG